MLTHIVTSSLLIVSVILIRAIYKSRVSPVLIYALWLTVLIKLCIPLQPIRIEFPSDLNDIVFSEHPIAPSEGIYIEALCKEESERASETVKVIYPEASEGVSPDETVSEDGSESNGGHIDDKTPAIDPISPPIGESQGGEGTEGSITESPDIGETIEPDVNEDTKHPSESEKEDIDNEALPPVPTEKEGISLKILLYSIAFIGTIIILSVFIVSYVLFSVRIRKDRRYVGEYKGLKMYVSDGVRSPCLSLLFPAIYLTSEAERSEGLSLIAEHEYVHYRHKDHIWSAFRGIIIAVYWYLPLVWLAVLLSRHDSELACDYAVTKGFSEKERLDYARLIIDTLPKRKSLYVNINGGSVKKRIQSIISRNASKGLSAALAILITLTAAGCSFTQADITGKDKGDPKDETSTQETAATDEAPTTEDAITTSEDTKETSEDSKVTSEDVPLYDKIEVLARDKSIALNTVYTGSYSHKAYDFGSIRLILVSEENNVFRLYITENNTELGSIVVKNISSFPAFSAQENGKYILYNISGDPNKAIEIGYDKGMIEYRHREYTYGKDRLLEEATDQYPFTSDTYPYYAYVRSSPNRKYTAALVIDDEAGHGGIELIDEKGNSKRLLSNILEGDTLPSGKKADINDAISYRPLGFSGDNQIVYSVLGYEWLIGTGIYNIETEKRTEYHGETDIVGKEGNTWYLFCYDHENITNEYNFLTIQNSRYDSLPYAFEHYRPILNGLENITSVSYRGGKWFFYYRSTGSDDDFFVNIYNDRLDTLLLSIRSPYELNDECLFTDEGSITLTVSVDIGSSFYDHHTEKATEEAISDKYLYSSVSDAINIISNKGNLVIEDMINNYSNLSYYEIFGGKYAFIVDSDSIYDYDGSYHKGSSSNRSLLMIDYYTRKITARCDLNGYGYQYNHCFDGRLFLYSYSDEGYKDVSEVKFKDGILYYEPCEMPQNVTHYPKLEDTYISPNGKYRVNKIRVDDLGNSHLELVSPDGSKKIFAKDSILNPNDPTDIGSVYGYKGFGFLDDGHFVFTSGGWENYGSLFILKISTGKITKIRTSDKKDIFPICIKDGNIYGHAYKYNDSEDYWNIKEIYRISSEGKATKLYDNPYDYSVISVCEDKFILLNWIAGNPAVLYDRDKYWLNITILDQEFTEKLFEGEIKYLSQPFGTIRTPPLLIGSSLYFQY